MAPITVLIAGPVTLFSEALAMALWWDPEIAVMSQYPATATEAVELIARTKPDVTMFDYSMRDMEGPAAASVIQARAPKTKVLLFARLLAPSQIDEALQAGAKGFLSKELSVDQVREAIRRVHGGESGINAQGLRELSEYRQTQTERLTELRRRMATLTAKEMDVLRLLSYGRMIPEIAKELGISQPTVKRHLYNLVKKTGAKTKEQAVAMARTAGLVVP